MKHGVLGRRIKERRERLKLTQSDLGNLIGREWKTISRYENGEGMPPADILYELALALGVSMDWLVGLAEERIPSDLTPDERELLRRYRNQSQDVKQRALLLLEVLDGL